jgi:hypothetical protein
VQALLSHYSAQLSREGWSVGSPLTDRSLAVAAATITADGTSWTAALIVEALAERYYSVAFRMVRHSAPAP